MTERADLPIVAALPALAQALAAHGRALLEAPPGAGKSTYLPLWLLDQGATPSARIVLMQPRRLAADSIARYLARQLGEPLGRRVGLRTRFDNVTSADTVIEVVTEGIFLRQIQRDPTLAGIGWVLFDEYHERSWQADLGLAFARETQSVWREADASLRLIVMSATLPAEAIAAWLDAPVVRAEGRSFPVEIAYSPVRNAAADRSRGADHMAREILAAAEQGARKILVFLPGWSAIARVAERLPANTLDIFTLHSQVPPEQQQLALQPPQPGRCAVVLATNIAETSLTIDGVDVVIDSGEMRRAVFDPARGMDRLETGWISRASATQRAGRAGRLGPGRCIRLWSQEQQGRLPAHDEAEIKQVDLASLALELALWGGAVDMLPEAPPASRLQDARRLLCDLHALDAAHRITASGRRLAELGVHPRLGRLIQLGEADGVPGAAALLAALLSEGDFVRADERTSVDLDWRLHLLAGKNHGAPIRHAAVQRIRQLAKQLARRSGGNQLPAHAELAKLLLAAFPDRLARQRDVESPRYLTVEGFEVQLDAHDALRQSPWLIVAEHDGARSGARIRLAMAIASSEVEAAIADRIETRDDVFLDEARGVVARRRRSVGAILLDERQIAASDEHAVRLWREQLQQRGVAWLQLSDAASAWLARVRWLDAFLRAQGSSELPDFSEAGLLADLDNWCVPYLAGVRKLTQLRQVDWLSALQSRLDYSQRQLLDRLAPARFVLPSGHAHTIDYRAASAPRLAARVQEFYGLNRHPAIADGRQPLLVELLSPAHRPVQLTQDLPAFWRSSYAEVRKDMKGRYPRHFWPEEPWCAPATTVTKRRMPNPG
jgi:ATP-dependent helicase HrpB